MYTDIIMRIPRVKSDSVLPLHALWIARAKSACVEEDPQERKRATAIPLEVCPTWSNTCGHAPRPTMYCKRVELVQHGYLHDERLFHLNIQPCCNGSLPRSSARDRCTCEVVDQGAKVSLVDLFDRSRHPIAVGGLPRPCIRRTPISSTFFPSIQILL